MTVAAAYGGGGRQFCTPANLKRVEGSILSSKVLAVTAAILAYHSRNCLSLVRYARPYQQDECTYSVHTVLVNS